MSWRRLLLGLFIFAHPAASAEVVDDYRRAEQFLPFHVEKLVFREKVEPHWLEKQPRFWYRNETREGKEFILIDAEEGSRRPAFDHERIAAALSKKTEEKYSARNLPFDEFQFINKHAAIEFKIGQTHWRCSLDEYSCSPEVLEKNVTVSPDGRWVVLVKDYNLYLRSKDSGEEIQLTFDGRKLFSYGVPLPSPKTMIEQGTMAIEQPVDAVWSPDSKKIATYRLDKRSARTLTLVQSTPPEQFRPRRFTYFYPLPGDVGLTMAEPLIVHVETRRVVRVDTPRLPLLYYSGPDFDWSSDSRKIYFSRTERGYQAIELLEADAETGQTRVLLEEKLEPHVDPHMTHWRFVSNGAEILWSSERDGWHHLYLFDGQTGKLKDRITRGEWVVREILHVDEENRRVYFTAAGKDGRDPYFRHLYRVNLDGSNLRLLTPENADHSISFSPEGSFFVDTYSRTDLPPVSVLRQSSNGEVAMILERADVEPLRATGWKEPLTFKGKGRDGRTDLYGLIWRPSNLDPEKKYPVIEQIYTGPHNFHVPKTFEAYRSPAQSIAELGFIVVMIDGMGTGRRSKAFRDVAYQNLGDCGLEDHIAVIRQMAAKYSFMDLDRVGVYGHSAGGYAAAHALLTYPEFYKVAVASAGNHDHRLDKAWWNELWMGYPVGDHYREQSNITLAHRLQGRLFLVHGEVDENVPPASTLRFVDALIQANKDFDLLILPNRFHRLREDPYFLRKRWDYFVRHLLGEKPPERYRIETGSKGKEREDH